MLGRLVQGQAPDFVQGAAVAEEHVQLADLLAKRRVGRSTASWLETHPSPSGFLALRQPARAATRPATTLRLERRRAGRPRR